MTGDSLTAFVVFASTFMLCSAAETCKFGFDAECAFGQRCVEFLCQPIAGIYSRSLQQSKDEHKPKQGGGEVCDLDDYRIARCPRHEMRRQFCDTDTKRCRLFGTRPAGQACSRTDGYLSECESGMYCSPDTKTCIAKNRIVWIILAVIIMLLVPFFFLLLCV